MVLGGFEGNSIILVVLPASSTLVGQQTGYISAISEIYCQRARDGKRQSCNLRETRNLHFLHAPKRGQGLMAENEGMDKKMETTMRGI